MKSIILCLFLAMSLTACSDNQQKKIDTFNKKNAKNGTDYIQKTIDQAKEVQKMTEKRIKDLERDQQ